MKPVVFAIFWKLHNDFRNHHTFSRFCWPICACSPFVYIYTPEQRSQILIFQKITWIFWKQLKNSEKITEITYQKPFIKPVVFAIFWKGHTEFQNYHAFSRLCCPTARKNALTYIYIRLGEGSRSLISRKYLESSEKITGITHQKPFIKPEVFTIFWPEGS